AGPDATTLPAPAPPPAGLARTSGRPSTTTLERLPGHGELFSGLYHLLVLLAVILVLAAMAATAGAFSTLGRSGGDPVAGTSPGRVVYTWQLAVVTWVFTVALLYVSG
ncbi:MAG: hypothetical protein GXP47_08540, partial [Acidobacteria bacterium]|nr:hypothetical protein [Acidobacteriota bacterium]